MTTVRDIAPPTLKSLDMEMGPHRNAYDCVSGGGNKDHNQLFHAPYVALKERYGLLDEEQKERERILFDKFLHPGYPGLLRSAPQGYRNANPHSHDNEKAALWLATAIDHPYAKDFLAHGRATGWHYNSEDPELIVIEGTYERFTGMIAQAQIAAGEKPGCFRSTWLNGELLLSASRGKGRLERMFLPYWMCKTVNHHTVILTATCENWKSRGFKKYPGGMGEVWQSLTKGQVYVQRGHCHGSTTSP